MKIMIFAAILLVSLSTAVMALDSIDDFREAIKAGDLERVEALVKRHPSWVLTELDEKHTTPLAMAIGQKDARLVEFFLRHGARAETPVINYRPPLYYAISTGSLDIVKLLVRHGAHVNAVDLTGISPARYAESLEQEEIEEYIRACGGR